MRKPSSALLVVALAFLTTGIAACSPSGDETQTSAPATLSDKETYLLGLNGKSFQNAEGRFFNFTSEKQKGVTIDILEVSETGDQAIVYDIFIWPDESGGRYSYKRADRPDDTQEGRLQFVGPEEFLLNDYKGSNPSFMDIRRRIKVSENALEITGEFFANNVWNVAIEEMTYSQIDKENMPKLTVEIPKF